ncbi:MAG: DinB family protein, partial [Anaerolineae bacterium]|nr:DinB family protein [Anaerolineae bacterium]
QQGIPRGDTLVRELDSLVADLRGSGAADDLFTAISAGIQGIREDRTIPFTAIPDVLVSRKCGDIYLGGVTETTDCGDDPLDLRRFEAIYYFDLMSPADVLAAMTAFPDTLAARIDGLSEDQMQRTPFPGEWSLRELIFHFAMAQEVLQGRLEQLVTSDNPTLKSVAVWTMGEGEPVTTQAIFERYRASRAKSIDLLAEIAPGDWWRGGYHDEFGPVTILSQACYFTRHERSHMPQWVALLNAIGGAGA